MFMFARVLKLAVPVLLVAALASCGGEAPSAEPTQDAGTTTAGDAGGAPCTPDTWSDFAKSFFVTNCDYCHGHDFASGVGAVQADPRVQSYISSGRMPQGTSLSSTDKSRILIWINCGYPQ